MSETPEGYRPPETCPTCGWWFCVCHGDLVQLEVDDLTEEALI